MGGTAEYTVRNPEEKTNYDNPMRTQLLQDGEEFRGAEPKLEPILKKNPKPGSIQYKNLDDNVKALLDGTVTVENYNQINTNTQQKQEVESETSNEIIVTDDNTSIDSKFGEDISDDLLDEFDSSVTELNNVEQNNITNYFSEDNIYHSSVTELANNVSNVESFTQQLPLDQQAKFTQMVTSAEVSVSCR